MKILITGGAGFVGTNMVVALHKEGFDLVAIDSLSRHGTEKNLDYLKAQVPNLDFRRSEIEDIPSIIYRERPALVNHFAAQVAVTSSLASPLRDFKINAEASFHIARAAADVGAEIIYTSTNKVFGDNVNKFPIEEFETRYDFGGDRNQRGVDEGVSIDANHHTPYGVSKLVGELYVREFGGIANRCSCMYGPNQFGIVDQGWLSHIAFNKHMGRPTVIYGNGKQVRDILHVNDVTNLFIRQAKTLLGKSKDIRGEVYNVGGGFENTISLLELCKMWGVEPTFEGWRPADQKVFYCDISKAKEVFGWEPRVDMQDGINELFEWTRSSVNGSPKVLKANNELEVRNLIDPSLESNFQAVYEKLSRQANRKSPRLVTTAGTHFEASAETAQDGRSFIQLPHSNRIYEGDWGYQTNSMGEGGQRIGQYSKALDEWATHTTKS